MQGMRRIPLLILAVALCAPASAPAAVPHTVQPGETLWSIAAANNLTTRTVAAFNGLSEDSHVVLGSTIMVPTVAEGAAKLATVAPPAPAAAPPGAAPPPAGAYTVQPGDTFSALAARTGVTAEQVAGVNGLDVDAPLIAGTAIKLPPAAAPTPATAVSTPRRRPPRRPSRPQAGSRAATSTRSPRSTASRARSRRPSPGRRAASTTRWSPPRTRAA